MGGTVGWKIYDRSMHMKIAKSLTSFVKDSIGTNDHNYSQAAPRISDMTPIKEIYIYSNLQSNTWTDEGAKVGYIAVFNVNQSQTEIVQQKEFVGDTYRTNEEISALKNMRFEFRDKWGDLIPFNRPYLVELAVFFK